MVFSSIAFLFQFLSIVVVCYYLPPPNIARLVLAERPDIVVQMPTAASLATDARAGEKRSQPAAFDYGL